MRGFIDIDTEAGRVTLGVAQIASIEPGGRRGQWAAIRMGNGIAFVAMASVEKVLDLIEDASAEPEAFAVDADPPKPLAVPPEAAGPMAAAMQEAVVKKEDRKRKGKS